MSGEPFAMTASPPPPGSYVLGDSGFSVYEEMATHLKALRWRRRPFAKAAQVDLILGDRFHIPYGELRCAALPTSSVFQGSSWVNYFQGSHKLTQKAAMTELLREVDSTCDGWMPQSFVLGGAATKKADERAVFLAAVEANPAQVWIVKPSSGAKGEEIALVRGTEEAEAFVQEKLLDKPESKRRYVVQQYVEKPLLLSHGRKFDVRVWALLTSPYSIYVFSQGSCRTASVPFDLSDIHNIHSHLTNHCLQEGSEAFGRFEPGNELWLPQLDEYLSAPSLGKPPGTLAAVVLPQMANIITRTLLSMKSQIETPADEPYRCFQLFGYDFIIEADLTVRLLEINGSPGVAERYLPTVVSRMLDLLGSHAGTVKADAEEAGGEPRRTDITTPSRQWDIAKEDFVLLWEGGDTVPPGLAV